MGAEQGLFAGGLLLDPARGLRPRTKAPEPQTVTGHEAEAPDSADPLVYTLDEFLAAKLPDRRPLLVGEQGSPILREKDLAMVFAQRGIGKTWLSLSLALAVATGRRFLRWHAPRRRRVLFVDGETAGGALQDRLRRLREAVPGDALLKILPADVQPDPLRSLATLEGQAYIEPLLDGVALLILDNISTLMSGMDENDANAWHPAQEWLLSLRRRGITVALAHHAGRSADRARGTSKREDVLDLVIRLTHPSDYSPTEGARFEVHFDKSRGILGRDLEPFEAWLQDGEWTLRDVAGRNRKAAFELFTSGARPADVAETLGVSRATAYRYLSEWKSRR